ncbi:hypothetical protein BDF22DRAFT_380885 [Syncephalis plumigaleata]|nr:hypothetical protein BDF22DRAFT_380885 [Syncephalis plumigaleata]
MIKSPNKRSAPKLDSFTKLRKVTLSSNDKDSSNHAHHSPSHHHIHHQHSPHTPHQHQHQHQPIAPALHTNSFSNGLFSVHTTTNPAEAALIENGLMLPSPTQSLSGTGLIPINSTGTSSTSPTATTASSTTTTVSSSSPVSGNGDNSELDPRLVAQMDRIFYDFLQGLCSNLNASDSRGDPIHQTLMAKKMHKMDQSTDFRPFKFRIQAFSNAFMEALARQGYDQTILPTRKVKQYLWRQKCISRFNEEGRKSKSKGNHVWNIEAKKLPSGSWIFREFSRRITGNPPREAYIGLRYCYTPRIWDPQMQCTTIIITTIIV